jgi:hypothetical protein
VLAATGGAPALVLVFWALGLLVLGATGFALRARTAAVRRAGQRG